MVIAVFWLACGVRHVCAFYRRFSLAAGGAVAPSAREKKRRQQNAAFQTIGKNWRNEKRLLSKRF